MAVINVQNWSVEQVVDWIAGLDPSLSQHGDTFTQHGITGQKLLTLMQGDLDYLLGISRIGDQLLLHDAIQTLRDELQTPWTTLQTLSLAVSVRCKNYRSELTQQKQAESEALLLQQQQLQQQNEHDHHHQNHHHHHHHHHHYKSSTPTTNPKSSNNHHAQSTSSHHHHNNTNSSSSSSSSSSNANPSSSSAHQSASKLETIPTTSLASASYLLDAGKVLIRWLTRFPFLGKLDYDEISRKLSKHCFELAVLSQRDTFADNAIEEVQYLCTKMIELCEALIHSKDSLVIQPAGIDIITLRKRNEQDWGLQFESSYWGLHQITGVKLSSPAQQSGHLERGDEILQVNYQTVLAWPQSSVVSLLHENDNEVILTVKRRPRHASTNLLLIGGNQNNNMYLTKVPNRKSFFERKAREELRNRVVITTTSSTTNPSTIIINSSIVEVVEDSSGGSSSDGKDAPASNIDHIAIPEVECGVKAIIPDDEKAAARFWKLYPKPKYLIKRRATVTGASPTETRPPVTFIHETSHTTYHPNAPQKPSSSSHQQVHHRRSTPVSSNNQPPTTTTTTTNPDSPLVMMQLLNPHPAQRPPLDKSRSAPEQGAGINEESAEEVKQEPDHQPELVQPEDDEVFGGAVTTTEPQPVVKAAEQRPTPKPRLSKSSIGSLKKQDNFDDNAAAKTVVVAPPAPAAAPVEVSKQEEEVKEPPQEEEEEEPVVEEQQQQQPHHPTIEEEKQPPTTPLHSGILHIRSQLRKQSSSNSASALPVIGQNSSQSQTAASIVLLSSSSPRWIRQNAVFYSNRELEIVNPIGRMMSTGSFGGGASRLDQQNFRVRIADIGAGGGVVMKEEFSVLPASEVHSRPFAFKITSGDSVTYYLAAESQTELDTWLAVMTTGEMTTTTIPSRNGLIRSCAGRNASSSSASSSLSSSPIGTLGGESGRRNFARAPYKRSVSLGSSHNPPLSASTQNIHSSTPPPQPPPTHHQQHPHHHPHYSPYNPILTRSTANLRSSTTNLSILKQKQPPPPPPSLLNRSKSSSLKTDWFLRNSPPSPSTNISSITITSKKTRPQQQASTQYPTPTGTPTKQQQHNTTATQPMMGVTMKTKKNSVSSTSPTRKYMCPNCCHVVKVDMGTQTERDNYNNEQMKNNNSEVKLVFFDNGGESRV